MNGDLACRDLNGGRALRAELVRSTMVRESRPNRLLSVVGLSAGSGVSPLRCSIRRRCAAARFLLLGSVSVDGLCPTDLSGWSSRHRSVPEISGRQALPYGFPRPSSAFHSG